MTSKRLNERRWLILAVGIMLFLIVLDQWVKLIVERRFMLGEQVEVISGWFNLSYVTNKGAAWGMFHGYSLPLLIVGIVVTVLAIWKMRYLTEGYPERILALFVGLSGVIGNSIDRLFRGHVVDFLDVYYHNWHWPTFNIADCTICICAGVFFLSIILRPAHGKSAAARPSDTDAPKAGDA